MADPRDLLIAFARPVRHEANNLLAALSGTAELMRRSPTSTERDIARARTFGFMKDVERLWAAGLALGASLENTVAIGDDRIIKLFGIGLASAVFFDAVIIRCLLVPAIMEILGRSAWWLPSWLDRRLPRLAIEAPEERRPATRPEPVSDTA